VIYASSCSLQLWYNPSRHFVIHTVYTGLSVRGGGFMEMIDLFGGGAQVKASDIHIVVGKTADGKNKRQHESAEAVPVLTEEGSKGLIYSMLYQDQIGRFEEKLELDFSYNVPGLSRFRVNVLSPEKRYRSSPQAYPQQDPFIKGNPSLRRIPCFNEAAQRPDSRHRSDRLRQIHYPCEHDRHHQHRKARNISSQLKTRSSLSSTTRIALSGRGR